MGHVGPWIDDCWTVVQGYRSSEKVTQDEERLAIAGVSYSRSEIVCRGWGFETAGQKSHNLSKGKG